MISYGSYPCIDIVEFGRFEEPLDDRIEKLTMFVRDVEDVCEVPFGLNVMRNHRNETYHICYLIQFICLPRAFKVVLESLRKGLYQDIDRV